MSEWRAVTLADLMVEAAGDPVDDPSRFPLVTVRLRGQGVVSTGKYPNRTRGGRAHFIRNPGQILVGRQNFHSGSAGIVPSLSEDHVSSNAISAFDARPGVSQRFLLHLLQWERTATAAEALMGGTGQKEISLRNLLTVPVKLPPIEEQERIGDLVEAVDAQIRALEAEVFAAQEARIRVVLAAPDAKPRALQELARVSQGKGLPKANQGQKTGSVPWFKIADMTRLGNGFGYRSAETSMTEDEIRELRGVVVPAGAVVFPRVGAAVLTEKKRILDAAGALDENHLILMPLSTDSSEYLLAVMETMRLSDFVQTGAVPSLNMGLVRRIEVPWLDEHAHLNLALGALRLAARARSEELTSLRAFRSTLVTALLSQSISIPDSYHALLDADPPAIEGAPV